jgi:hypothetical protein
MAMISVDYTFNLPNEPCVDHEQTDGNTRTATYDGPDTIFLIINNETGLEECGPITELEKADGRPVPDGCRYLEVDCITNPLVCELRAPVLDEEQEDYTSDARPPGVVEVDEHHAVFTYQTPLSVTDVYDPLGIIVDSDDNITLTKRSPCWLIMGGDGRLPTYDDVRNKRMQLLKNSDSEITDDMPAAMRQRWLDYRQRLRDWPSAMEDLNIPAEFAYNMEPHDPGMDEDPADGSLYDM